MDGGPGRTKRSHRVLAFDWDGYFKVSIFVPEKVRLEALKLPLENDIINLIADAKQMGKLKFFPLIFDRRSSDNFDDIYTLIDFRKMIK